MTTAALVFLAASLGAPPDPLPDGKSIDSLTLSFSSGVAGLGPSGSLTVFIDGKVNYSHATAPSTGSGGVITNKQWTLTKDETAALFRKLIEDGLLDAPPAKGALVGQQWFTVTSGRWKQSFSFERTPDKIMAHLRPLLVKAHPALWEEKAEKPAPAGKPKFTRFDYTFTRKPESDAAILSVNRDGTVLYKRETSPNVPGVKVLVKEEWKMPAKDAEALFDALTADGLFDLEDTLGGKFPNHHIHAQAGRWQTTFHPKEMPEKLLKHFHPLLKKADAEFWK